MMCRASKMRVLSEQAPRSLAPSFPALFTSHPPMVHTTRESSRSTAADTRSTAHGDGSCGPSLFRGRPGALAGHRTPSRRTQTSSSGPSCRPSSQPVPHAFPPVPCQTSPAAQPCSPEYMDPTFGRLKLHLVHGQRVQPPVPGEVGQMTREVSQTHRFGMRLKAEICTLGNCIQHFPGLRNLAVEFSNQFFLRVHEGNLLVAHTAYSISV